MLLEGLRVGEVSRYCVGPTCVPPRGSFGPDGATLHTRSPVMLSAQENLCTMLLLHVCHESTVGSILRAAGRLWIHGIVESDAIPGVWSDSHPLLQVLLRKVLIVRSWVLQVALQRTLPGVETPQARVAGCRKASVRAMLHLFLSPMLRHIWNSDAVGT